MPDETPKTLVINTSPLIALIAAFDSLDILNALYDQVLVPFEVACEIKRDNATRFGADVFNNSTFLLKSKIAQIISPYLKNSLDIGEASVIQLALNENIQTVCIDELVGRRVARLNGLKITGSLGIIIKSIRNGMDFDLSEAISNMRRKNIYISNSVERDALQLVNKE